MESLAVKPERLPSIDAFRGLAVLLMAAVNYIGGISWMPAVLKHSPDIGYTLPDVVAPMFIMAVGFTMGLSARRRRERQGAAATLGGIAVRYLAILGIGAIISAGQSLCLPEGERLQSWGVLQAIGGAGLLTLLVIYLKPWARALAGLALLAGFQWLLSSPFIFNAVFGTVQGSIIGSLSWGGMLMVATAAADWFFASKTPVKRWAVLMSSGIAALASGLLLSQWFPISKNRASASYMLVSLGLCLLLFLFVHLVLDGRSPRAKLMQAVGKNPLAMYMAHLLILGAITLPGAASWYSNVPAWLAAVQGAVLLSTLLALAWWMQRRNFVLKL
jgi:predicted acyltransferase